MSFATLGRPQQQHGTCYRSISQISTHHPPSYPMVPPRHSSGPSSCSEMVIGCLHTTT